MSPMPYSSQIPSPITSTQTTIMANNNNRYLQKSLYLVPPTGPSTNSYYSQISPSYSPDQSPLNQYCDVLGTNLISDHGIKLESVHNHNHSESRGSSIDEEQEMRHHGENSEHLHDLDSHLVNKHNMERASVVNVKME